MGRLIRWKLEGKTSRRRLQGDPLLEISGIGTDGELAEGIDEALYGI